MIGVGQRTQYGVHRMWNHQRKAGRAECSSSFPTLTVNYLKRDAEQRSNAANYGSGKKDFFLHSTGPNWARSYRGDTLLP